MNIKNKQCKQVWLLWSFWADLMILHSRWCLSKLSWIRRCSKKLFFVFFANTAASMSLHCSETWMFTFLWQTGKTPAEEDRLIWLKNLRVDIKWTWVVRLLCHLMCRRSIISFEGIIESCFQNVKSLLSHNLSADWKTCRWTFSIYSCLLCADALSPTQLT